VEQAEGLVQGTAAVRLRGRVLNSKR
jgi:hypothetical protein